VGTSPPLAFLNIGGVANVTWIGPDGELIAFDTGPGNALMDDWIYAVTGMPFDIDGSVAGAGAPDEAVVRAYLQHPYFAEPPPKSLDRNAFSLAPVRGMRAEDGAATLLAFTVESVFAAGAHLPAAPRLWVGCGGGRHNTALVQRLAAALAGNGQSWASAEDVGLDGDAVEAQAFAYMAVRTQRDLPITFPGTTGVPRPTCGGRIAAPGKPGGGPADASGAIDTEA
jgi:anhydro-N-acetylmuramic acid kinase